MLVIPTACAFATAVAGIYPYGGTRHCFFLAPMIYLFAGFGFAFISAAERALERKHIALVFVGLVIALGLRDARAQLKLLEPQHMRPIVTKLAAEHWPGDRVFVYYKARPAFRYYDRKNAAPSRQGLLDRQVSTPIVGNLDKNRTELEDMLSAEGRVSLVLAQCWLQECEDLLRRAGREENVELIAEAQGIRLFLAQPETLNHPDRQTSVRKNHS